MYQLKVVHASLPFTVLKQDYSLNRHMRAYHVRVVHASLPFTVLKLSHLLLFLIHLYAVCRACLLTVYGFETLRNNPAGGTMIVDEGRACLLTVYGFET